MKCLILAAGRGSRLTGEGDSKPLVRVAGLPLIERTIATAQRAGFTDFYVVTGYNAPALEAFLSELSARRNLSITPIRNPSWEAGNGTSLLAAREALDSNFILLMADHVFEEGILTRLLERSGRGRRRADPGRRPQLPDRQGPALRGRPHPQAPDRGLERRGDGAQRQHLPGRSA